MDLMVEKTADTSKIQSGFRFLLGAMMLLAGIGHMTFQRLEFQAQVPPWLPFEPDFVVLASGVVEIVLGLAMLFFGRYKIWVGLALAAFYVLIFPGNISQYVNQVDAFGLDTDQQRFNRLLFQPVLIAWALWSTGAYRVFFGRKGRS
ncbi:hypothetical protein VDG1235_3050 [Verrucomicrobiia bacterium DG1235]|nr:hypothetical protein VDG1235_3050 [Verrucomicrobiae bacterium DG1235]